MFLLLGATVRSRGPPWLPPPSSSLAITSGSSSDLIAAATNARRAGRFDELECLIKYTFKDVALLIQVTLLTSLYYLQILVCLNLCSNFYLVRSYED
ncbi:unnamed protein product [Protopolystoma xenopodis]|uniref:Uncharacterized protein n=1 Tax=Protopolystoma xenopodis TaxID=117903 RepID=A0A448WTJ7_9PLAT|nr:unnamed protein product [Protopolystoma xenopodis]